MFFERKSDFELEQMLRAYLTGPSQIPEDAVFSICQIPAARKMPLADPSEIYCSHLAVCFADDVNTNS